MRSKQDQLQHGETEVKEKSKPEPAVRRAEDDAYIALKRILLQPSAKVILAACDALAESEQYEKFLGAAVRLFHANDRILPLMKLMVTREVMYTLDPSTLFRQDSIATKLLSVYAKEVGMVYLQACLLGPMMRLCMHDPFSPEALELDPLKLVEGANAEANAENLQAVVTDFLQSIYAQTVNCPPGFREMAGCLQEEVGSKFPSFKTQAVAGFLFLRFLCPAMLNPKGYGIMEETPNRPEFRALILVSKIVQQLANGARPGKQDFMQVMESYITTKLSEMTEFLYAYAVKSEIREVDEVSPSVTQVEKEALDVLQKVMKYNIHKIGRVIVTSNEQRKSWRKNVADNAEKQGYLKKKGEISVTSSWRTRWFVLKNRFLYYFKSPQHSTSAGAIPLGKCTVKAVELEAKDKDKDSQEFCFEIVTNYRTYCLMAATESERLKWIEAIEAKIKSTETVPLSPVAQSLTPLSTSGSSITTAKKGYLIKRGNMVKNWKKRWFVLKDHLLFYYKTHTDPSPKGEVPIQHCFVRRSDLKDAETQFVFELTVAERTFVFCAPDEETVKSWMDAIKRSKNEWWKTEQDRKGKHLERKPASLRDAVIPGVRNKITDVESAKRALIRPEREGFLIKQGASVRTWKRQWCVVSEGRLYYFKTPNDDTAAGFVALEDSAVERSAVGGFCLEIVTRERRHFFRANDREDMEAWISVIRLSASKKVESVPDKGLSVAVQGSTRKAGWLLKMGAKVNSTWCRRWIVIHDSLLSYYQTPQDEDPNGVIPLENSSLRFVEGKQGSFEIFTQYRKYFFMARNEIEASEWIEAIQHARVSGHAAAATSEADGSVVTSFHHLHEALEMFRDTDAPAAPPKHSLVRPLSLALPANSSDRA